MKKMFLIVFGFGSCANTIAQVIVSAVSIENETKSSVGSFITVNTENVLKDLKYTEKSYKTPDGGSGIFLRSDDNSSAQQNNFIPKIIVFPNPASGYVNVETNIESPKEIIVYDILGNPVYRMLHVISKYAQLDLAYVPRGVYLIRVTSGELSYWAKSILQ